MTKKITCPYCGQQFEPDLEYVDVFSEEKFQQQCPHCENVVNLTPSVTIDFDVDKCACQLENHEWKLQTCFPQAFAKMECIHCGMEREPTEEERLANNMPSKKEYLESL